MWSWGDSNTAYQDGYQFLEKLAQKFQIAKDMNLDLIMLLTVYPMATVLCHAKIESSNFL